MKALAENIWFKPFPLKMLGVDLHRNVTVIRLPGGELVVHSTAPFSEADVAEIRKLGEVRWILDALLDHDTFAKAGREAFPEAQFLGPEGFSDRVDFPCEPLVPSPPEWGTDLQVIAIEGLPSMAEHVVFHQLSKTLIVADLMVNFDDVPSAWARLLLRIGVGAQRNPGASRRLKLAIRDKDAFRASVRKVMQWDFDRVIVGHGWPLERDAKKRAQALCKREGWD